MKKDNKVKLFLVDDDALYLKSLEIEFLKHGEFIIETYATGELCLQNLHHNPDFIILDYFLDGIEKDAMNGIETLDKIMTIHKNMPVIMLSSQDKIDVAISCMHHHALDYVMKSETSFMRIQKIISNHSERMKLEKVLNWYEEKM
jgi:two-component system OmpR family response regulator